MQLILKAVTVKHPGSRGGQFWLDEKGQVRYDEKPKGEKRPHKYLAIITLSDGSQRRIEPNDDELDANGQVIGGQAKVREIINRELFGEYGFKTNGTFWQKRGILVEYKTRVTARGKIEVDAIERHKGYTAFDFRDASVARAYGGDEATAKLPKKITQYLVEAQPRGELPSKEKVELPEGTTPDQPPIEELGIHTVPPRKPQTEVALIDKLTSKEDPIAIASAYLAATFEARKPSQAKTPEGQAKARAERAGQFAGIEGHRKIDRLPIWARAKFDSAEHLQTELSREGRPLTTLITLGAWDPDNKNPRIREQLVKEWSPFIRRWARKFATVYQSTDSYRSFDKLSEGVGEKGQRDWLRDRERDLYNEAVAVLLDEANKYMANDEPKGSYSRFDLKAQNAIKNHLEKHSKRAAVESFGATHLEDLTEEDAYHAPKMISPRDQFELRHYESQAVPILADIVADLKPHVRAVFESRLWIDDYLAHPDQSEEHAFNEAREARRQKHGESNLHWGRPWIRTKEGGVTSVSDKLADVEVRLQGGKVSRLGDLKPQHQMYYLEKWFADAMAHVESHLQTKRGHLSPDGQVVEKWLRLEEKLARVNHKEITGRVEHKVVQMPIKLDKEGRPVEKPPLVEHIRHHEHPALTFFKQPGSNRQLAERLGIVNDLDMPVGLRHMNLPKQHEDKLKRIASYHHHLQQNLAHVGDLTALHKEQFAHVERARDQGSWYTTPNGSMEWHENNGVVALHEAAVKLHKTKGEDKEALAAYTSAANALGAEHPMVQDYTRRLATLGVDAPTQADLAQHKARSHSAYREQANRLHIIEFAQEQRNAKKSLADLRDAFAKCLSAYDDLGKAFR